ncbi:hypothetical protein HYW21_00415 [Candidatus Woesearchaeota archaeon]|nr:hypothetical protein [Candidatus Woesearchaeota archaeon]
MAITNGMERQPSLTSIVLAGTAGITSLALAGVLALGGVGCAQKSTENTPTGNSSVQTQPQYPIRQISGKIVGIDEDSFAIRNHYYGANFEFEHLRIETSDGKIHKLIFPGPSNYQTGDSVDLQYREQERVPYVDLIKESTGFEHPESFLCQNGFFEVDGLIQR